MKNNARMIDRSARRLPAAAGHGAGGQGVMSIASANNLQRGRNWRDLHPWLRAGMVGIALLAAVLAVYWALWKYWVDHPSSDSSADLGLQLLFGIATAAFSTVLIAGVLGYRAHNISDDEAAIASTAPLKLTASKIEESERANSLLGARPVRIGLNLANESDHLETWFRATIDLPILAPVWEEFPPSDEQIDRALFLAWAIPQRLNEEGDNWRLNFRRNGTSWQITAQFQSLGNVAIFPHSSTQLCMLSLPTEHFRPRQTFSCHYRIESGHSAPIEDTLVIGM